MTSLRELDPDVRDLLLAFCKERVEFLVVGAHALALHGVRNKQATGRPRDLADVARLRRG